MKTSLFKVDGNLCSDCTFALRRFIGGMEGVEGIDAGPGEIAIRFDEAAIGEDKLRKIALNSMESLGYRVEEEK